MKSTGLTGELPESVLMSTPEEMPAEPHEITPVIVTDEVIAEWFVEQYNHAKRAAHRTGISNNDNEAADDVAQKVFLNILEASRRGTIRAENPAGLVRTVARNVAINLHRKESRINFAREGDDVLANRRPSYAYEGAQEAEVALEVIEGEGAVEELLASIANDEMCTTVKLTILDGYSEKEVAELQGIPVGTVKSRLNRAKKRMQKAVEEQRKREEEAA
jgi:RNA polymerase sigma-70 factor, ECF subfamily